MTMLTHIHTPSGRAHYSPETREAAQAAAASARLATIKRLCLRALAVLMVGGALAGIIALKTAIYLSRLNHL
jgi:hypothetical protein